SSVLAGRVEGVFHYDRHTRYGLTFPEAKAACEWDFGAVISSRDQLYAAYKAGLEECRAGWILLAEVAYPRIHQTWKCGQNRTGIVSYGVRKSLMEKWDVYCYNTMKPHKDSCGGILRETKGKFQSPGFPQSYQSDMDCIWVIEVPVGYHVVLDFHSLVLEEHRTCQYDYVIVYGGQDNRKELGRFCGPEVPPQLQAKSSVMTVIMRSDSSVELDGFLAHFSTVKPSQGITCSNNSTPDESLGLPFYTMI
uniref:Uncharacterized protein n=1 Tax=Latimeria chalumnae TaxID=7897 RepID=H3A6L9_LATCH